MTRDLEIAIEDVLVASASAIFSPISHPQTHTHVLIPVALLRKLERAYEKQREQEG